VKINITHETVSGEHIFCKIEIQDVCIVTKLSLDMMVIKDSRVGKRTEKSVPQSAVVIV